MRVLVVNAGSSSLKLRTLGPDGEVIMSRDLPPVAEGSDQSLLSDALSEATGADAVGHRMVHGGASFSEGTLIDGAVRRALDSLIDLAPLHLPLALAALDVVSQMLPDLPAVACFDTAFHRSLSPEAATYAIPAQWRDRYGIKRYGFHGFSHAYAARRAGEILGRPVEELRIVTCHLGAGASLAAVRHGTSVDTTMGFTPLEGLVMATRPGTIDPGILLWLLRRAGLSADEAADALEHRSGLKALAGSADMREILTAAEAGEAAAQLALDVYLHRLCASIAAMAASMGGLDAVTFTGGVGENAWQIRRSTAERLGFLGVHVDPDRNRAATGDADITASGASTACLVITSREDIEVAREVRRVLADRPG